MNSTNRPVLHSPRPRAPGSPTALQGLRVVDFSHFIAGPVCTLFLADMGAEVIKIENAKKGDDLRRFQPHINGESAAFIWANRNKLGIALDLTQKEAREIAKRLIATADILVENFSAGVMERFGLGYDAMAALNPRLIYCSISAYGRDGSLADRLGFDPVVQAESGFMSLNGYPDRPGVRTAASIMDISCGMTATIAVLGALAARERLGRGQQVDVALFDTATFMLGFHAANYLATGHNPARSGNSSTQTAPTGVFNTADGPIFLACSNDRSYQRFVSEVLERRDLIDDPAFATNELRVRNAQRLTALIETALSHENRAYWTQRMRAAGVPAGEVRTIEEAFRSDEMIERELATEIAHPVAGQVPNIAPPFQLRATPVIDPVAAPFLGQHTRPVLAGTLGYDDATINALASRGAIVGGDGEAAKIKTGD
jgi:crotonobetainyl-CoA:carnitine CoA-transferase CaiB-like acyl-CoA transferase